MNDDRLYGELGCLSNASMLGREALDVIQETINNNNAVGTIIGYYDSELTILSVSDFMLHNLGYTYEEFMDFTNSSLKPLFYGENRTFLEPERFPKIHGMGEGEMLTKDGTPITVRMVKDDSVDKNGIPIWIIAARTDWEHENMTLVTGAIKSGLWYMDCDENGQIQEIHWSHAFRKMLGYHDTIDFPNRLASWADLLHPADKDKTLKQLKGVIADRKNIMKYDIEYRLRMQDGSYQWFRANAEKICRRDGSSRRITGILVNVDAEKQAALQQKKAEAFHTAFTKTNLCEYYVNFEENTFEPMKIEPSVQPLFDRNRTWEELTSDYIKNYVCVEYKEEVRQFYDRAYMKRKLGKIQGELSLECCIILNGEKRWLRNVVISADPENGLALIFLRDITDAKQEAAIQKQISAENEAMGHLIQSVTRLVDHFAICDLENDRYEYSMINIKADYPPRGAYHEFIQMITAHYKTLAPEKPFEQILEPGNLRAQIRNEKDIYRFEYSNLEETCYRSASCVPLEWKDGVLMKVLWVSMDMTHEKKQEIEGRKALKDAYEAAERANRAKTEFLTNMSHDIRTPMNAIVGLTAIAGANIDHPDKVLECLGKTANASRHLLGLINEVLDMARIESGKISLAEEEFNLSDLVDNLVSMVKTGIDEHHHQFEVNIRHIEHEDVYGDTLRIQQIFMNVMSNAIKYTPDGGKIVFSIEEKMNGQTGLGCYVFCIEDNGIGMDEKFQKIMFQPFTRADDKRTGSVQGTGLGMAITQNIVNMMNGNIKVESAPQKGTKFTVTIFLKLQEKGEDQIKELVNLPVLVVDDEPSSCESTVETLHEIGIAGEWVTSGEEAIARTFERHERHDDYFAIIMDWKMPRMDGIETTRQIRKRVGREVTIIVLTAYDYSEIEDEARKGGVDAFITKPLFRSRLTAAFMQIINEKPQTSAKDFLKEIRNAGYAGRRVLLVEDNALNSEIASEIIGMAGVQVETADNGQKAVEKIETSPEGWYDLVFMDIQMPVMNGYEATAAIRALDGSRGSIPIVAMTANAFAEDVQLAKSTGMNEHMAKPLDFRKLEEILRRYVGKQPEQQQ